ncbi:MAG: hypothetical protein ACOYB3_00010 [Azonexus sp.]
MSQFTVYSSGDASAPVLTGEVNKLVAVLDACLVTGYGAKSAAGWTMFGTGANKAAFKSGAGTGFYLRVQDDAPGTGGAREARMTGYVAMTDVNTGTGPFPTAAQGVGGVAMVVCRKSETASAVVRSWYVIADSRTCYVLVSWNNLTYGVFVFGDFYAYNAADTSNCIIIGRPAEQAAGGSTSSERLDIFSALANAITGHFVARDYNNSGASITVGKHGDAVNHATLNVGITPYPNGPDSGVYMSRVYVVENASSTIRGYMRGYWHFCHAAANINTLDIWSGTNPGDLAGRAFLGFKSPNSGINTFETSNTVETN